jgi:anaerobic selenocysteine-containing dehydrogenase
MKKIERKDFLKLAGGAVCGGLVGTTLSGAPFLGLQWLVEWTQDQHVPPRGEEKYVNGVCQACGTTISVRMIGNRAVKVETANKGCPVCQAMLQLLYHSERVQTPLKRTGRKGAGRFEPVSWEEAIKDISAKIASLRSQSKPQAIAAINAAGNMAPNLFVEHLVMASGSRHVYEEASFATMSASAVKATQNLEGSIEYDFENADYVLSFGARLLEGWGNQAAMHRTFLKWKENGAKLVQVDTLATRTASLADRWVPIKAGSEAILAMGIAHQLINNHGKAANLADLSRWTGINEFTPDKVSELTGVPAATISEIAREFVTASSAVAVAGRGTQAVSSSVPEIIAVQCLNALLARLGKRGNAFVRTRPSLPGNVRYDEIAVAGHGASAPAKGLDDFIKNAQKPELLFINEANPVYNSVYSAKMADKLKEIPMVVSFNTIMNDTAQYADYVLPTMTIMESGAAGAEGVVAPRYRSRNSIDVIVEIAKKVEKVADLFPWSSYREALGAVRAGDLRNAGNFSLSTDMLRVYFEALKKTMSESRSYPLALVPFEVPLVGDGRNLALPYVLKGIGGEVFNGERMWVQMNPETAHQQGVSDGSNIYIESSRGEIGKVKVLITKTVAPGVVAVPMGFGHEGFTKYGDDKGVNPRLIMADAIDAESGTADWWYTRVKIS